MLSESPGLFIAIAGLAGLLVGSFLNVVILRLPRMLERSWRQECLEFLGQAEESPQERFDLIHPPSTCPQCGHSIRPWENIPVLSYLFLKGRCAHCKTPISLRYPLIELLTALLSVVVAWNFGFSVQALWALVLTWSLIALSFIDIDHQLLPDALTLPLLWLGMFLSLFNVFTDSHSAILGAIAGYLLLWAVYQLFKLVTGKEGMGFGDFKLLALFGAWLGWQALPMIILLSSLVGAVLGIAMILLQGREKHLPIPFGPYLAIAGWIALLWGERLNQWYLGQTGLG